MIWKMANMKCNVTYRYVLNGVNKTMNKRLEPKEHLSPLYFTRGNDITIEEHGTCFNVFWLHTITQKSRWHLGTRIWNMQWGSIAHRILLPLFILRFLTIFLAIFDWRLKLQVWLRALSILTVLAIVVGLIYGYIDFAQM